MTRSLWQALMTAGLVGWTTAIGVHPAIGYNVTRGTRPPR